MSASYSAEALFLARLLLGGAFVFAGLRNIQNTNFLTQVMSARGVPLARLALWVGIALQVVAGLAFITGMQAVLAAAVLIVFLLAATPMFHNFWDHQGPDRAARINGFVSNVALTGAFLFVAASSI